MNVLLTTDCFFHPLDHTPTYHAWLLRLIGVAMNGTERVASTELIHEVLDRVGFDRSLLPQEAYSPLSGSARSHAENALRPHVCSADLIVAFEPSREMRSWLDTLDTPHIDIFLHPVRFYKDLLFSVRASTADLQGALARFAIPQSELRVLGEYWKQILRERTEPLYPDTDVAVIIGQTSKDMSVWNGERMLALTDVRDQIEVLKGRHETVLFRGHPFERMNNQQLIDGLPFIQTTMMNTYRLLAQDTVTLYALSSSMVEEARLFGQQGAYFWQPLFNADDQDLTLSKRLISTSLWRSILDGTEVAPAADDAVVLNDDVALNRVRGVRWSYPYLRQVAGLEPPPMRLKDRIRRRLGKI